MTRVAALAQLWLEYSRTRVFDGGCFFLEASVEFDARPGAVRDAAHRVAAAAGTATSRPPSSTRSTRANSPGLSDAAQLAFELQAFFDHANTASVLLDSEEPYRRASRAIADRLRSLGAEDVGDLELVRLAAPPGQAPSATSTL